MDERLQAILKFEEYLKRRAPESRTWVDYVSDVRQFAASCLKPWLEVSLHDIDAFVDQQHQAGLSRNTIKRRVYALKVFFDFLAEEQEQLAWPNPVRPKRHGGKPAKRLPRDLSDEQVLRLWQVIDHPRDQAWFALMLRTGLRVAEVASLSLSDLLQPASLEQPGRLRVLGKGQKERVVLMTADTAAILQAWLQLRPDSEHQTVFLNERGQPLSPNGIEWLLRGYSQKAQLKATPHQLRHTFARQLLEGGLPLSSLAKLLGHAQISTTEIYTAGADPELAQAYQQAMVQLSQQPPLAGEPPFELDSSPAPPSPSPAPTPFRVAPPPDWQSWAPHLPDGLRQASIALVQRRLPQWKPQRQRLNAIKTLGHFRRFWEWQLAHRPITEPEQLRRSDLQAFQSAWRAAGKTASTINRHLDEILALLRELVDQDQPIDPRLLRLSHLPQPARLPRHLTETQAQCLDSYLQQHLDQADPQLRLEHACLAVLAHTGLRASECVELQVQDLDLPGRRLIVREGKGRRDRVVYLSDLAQQALSLYLPHRPATPTGPLFYLPNGQPITYRWLYLHIKAMGQTAGQIELSPHRLRHTLATRLLNQGMKETRIQKLLGHQHLSTTMIYARVLDPTVEADYRQAMSKIERQQLPLSRSPHLVNNWPISDTFQPGQSIPLIHPTPANSL